MTLEDFGPYIPVFLEIPSEIREEYLMFAGLESLSSSSETTASEPTATTTITVDVPKPPPTRFGATRILLPKDPNTSVITILEQQNDQKTNDYIVYISSGIRCENVYYAELLTLLRTLTSDSKVDIYISSPGGSLHTGAAIANAVKTSRASVTTIAVGIVASAAALIWSYGHNRVATEGSVVMFHMSSHGDYDNSKAIQVRAANTVRYVKEVAVDPLVEEGLLTPDEAETIIDKRRDLWLDSTTLNARLEAIHAKTV